MPAYWTPKQERQYKHIKTSCISRKCRRVRGKKKCVRTCTRIAAATTNKFRARGLGGLQVREVGTGFEVWNDRTGRVVLMTDDRSLAESFITAPKPRTFRIYEKNGRYDVENVELPYPQTHKPRYTSRRVAESQKKKLDAAEAKFQERWRKQHGTRGLGAVRGKCCVVRGRKRIACFHSKKDAVALKRSMKSARGLRIRCV